MHIWIGGALGAGLGFPSLALLAVGDYQKLVSAKHEPAVMI